MAINAKSIEHDSMLLEKLIDNKNIMQPVIVSKIYCHITDILNICKT